MFGLSTRQLLSLLIKKPSIFFTKNSKYLFILSHMRSRSSVLCHVLGSNLNIHGYSELHRSYTSYQDFLDMRLALYGDLKCDFKEQYLLDKVLHNYHHLQREIFQDFRCKYILLFREPESTVKSLINMAEFTGSTKVNTPEKAVEYYCKRLSYLKNYVDEMQGDFYFLESDDLINKTDTILQELTLWLDLKEPLKSRYTKFSKTGRRGHGDPSDNIRAGKIQSTTGYPNIDIPRDLLEKAQFSYDQLKALIAFSRN